MPAESLVAKANIGAGTDNLAGKATAAGFVGAVMLTDQTGADITTANPLKVSTADVTASGTFTAVSQTLELTLGEHSAWSAQIEGTWVGSIQFQGQVDGVNWKPILGALAGIGTVDNFTTANAIYRGNASGLTKVRAIMTAYTSGTTSVSLRASTATGATFHNGPILTQRRDLDTTPAVDGGNTPLFSDQNGRLKVSTQAASLVDITGNITTIQATINTPVVGGTVTGDVSQSSNIMVFCTGTFAGVNVVFEGSLEATGETSWFAVQAVRSNANVIELTTGVLAASPAYAWELSVNALARFRVRATAYTSGTQAWRFKQGTYATEPIPAVQVSATQPVSGTVTATVGTSITGGTIAPLTVAGVSVEASSAKTVTGTGATITNASANGVMLFLNCTVASGTTPMLTVRVQVQDPVSLAWVDLPGAAFAVLTGVTATPVLMVIEPGLVAAANAAVNMPLPRTWRLAWTITGTTPSFTFSVGAQYII